MQRKFSLSPHSQVVRISPLFLPQVDDRGLYAARHDAFNEEVVLHSCICVMCQCVMCLARLAGSYSSARKRLWAGSVTSASTSINNPGLAPSFTEAQAYLPYVGMVTIW